MKRVLVALSGGVDSATTLTLLKKEGYDCKGVTMRLRDSGQENDIAAAEKLCKQFGVPFDVVDLRAEFKQNVTDYFVNSYLKGVTPNPCVECNRKLKSERLLEEADKKECDYLATGHYARLININGQIRLYRALDLKRDQSYFLYPIKHENLSRILFPLGGYTKDVVRSIAYENGVGMAGKKDSQDVCFIPDGDYVNYIKNSLPDSMKHLVELQGDIVYHNKVVGLHKGLVNYTIGQRSGLGVSLGHPVYVTKIDTSTNTLHIGERDELNQSTLTITNVNMHEDVEFPLECSVKIRSVSSLIHAVAKKTKGDAITFEFDGGVEAVTRGQSGVIYKSDDYGEYVVGGGIIV